MKNYIAIGSGLRIVWKKSEIANPQSEIEIIRNLKIETNTNIKTS